MNFVIVGAGGAGGVVAKELSTAGFQVVVLEQGPYFHEEDFTHDELKFKDVFDPPFIGREVLTNDHALQPNTFRKTESEKAALTAFARSKARVWSIGRSPMPTSNLTTPRQSGKWGSPAWRELIPSTLRARSLTRCRRCLLSLLESCWNGVHASWVGIPIRRRLRFCRNLTTAGRHVHTAVSVNPSGVSGVPNRARSPP